MPSTYAHRRFGADVLALLPDGLRQTLEQHRELYDMGLHGPDLMFYYKALQTNPVNRLGNAMHEEKGEVFFTRARAVVEHAADKDAALAYALGFVCHFALDSTCHPYVCLLYTSPGSPAASGNCVQLRPVPAGRGAMSQSSSPTGSAARPGRQAASLAPSPTPTRGRAGSWPLSQAARLWCT